MRSRRRIACPEAQDYANSPDYIRDLPLAKWGSEAWLHGSELEPTGWKWRQAALLLAEHSCDQNGFQVGLSVNFR
jgi:hypothetical protein